MTFTSKIVFTVVCIGLAVLFGGLFFVMREPYAEEEYVQNGELIPIVEIEHFDPLLAIEEKLYPLHTIFCYGNCRYSGALISHELATGKWFNRYGEQVEQPWYIRYSTAPWGFALYDFDGSGIPALLIYYGGIHFGGPPAPMVYMFLDGKYVPTVWLDRMPSFYLDNYGNLIVFYSVAYGGRFGYYYLIRCEYEPRKELISAPDFNDMDSWWAHLLCPNYEQYPTIYRMPERTLTPVVRLYELEVTITESIIRRHGL